MSKKNKKDFVVRRRIHNGKLPLSMPKKIQRNDPCHCGSKKKYKSCCGPKDEAAMGISAEDRAKAIAQALEKEKEVGNDEKIDAN